MPKSSPAVPRPLPTFATRRGLAAYDPREIAAYRMALGITAEDLAVHMKTQRTAIARLESFRRGQYLEARFGDRLLAHAEKLATNRIKLAEEGIAMLEDIRSKR